MTQNHKKKKHFITWLLIVLPIFLFVVILGRVITTLLSWIWKIVQLLPQSIIWSLGQSETFVHMLCLLILCGLIWLLGFVINRWKIGHRIKVGLNSIISRVPILNSLSRITNQVANTLQNTDSFKKVVLLKFPTEKTWSIWFVTWENTSMFDENLKQDDLVSIFIPTTPNPTNGFLVLVEPKDFVETQVPVATALSFIISMGTAGATEEVLKQVKW